MKRVKQVEESKRMIAEAFVRLLAKDSMDDIAVSRIAVEAKVGRNTFYNHFRDKEDILRYLLEGLIEDARKAFLSKPEPSLRDFLLWRFRLIKENPRLRVFKKDKYVKAMVSQLRQGMADAFKPRTGVDEYAQEFFFGGIDYMTARWMGKGMKESPEEMTAKALSLLGRQGATRG